MNYFWMFFTFEEKKYSSISGLLHTTKFSCSFTRQSAAVDNHRIERDTSSMNTLVCLFEHKNADPFPEQNMLFSSSSHGKIEGNERGILRRFNCVVRKNYFNIVVGRLTRIFLIFIEISISFRNFRWEKNIQSNKQSSNAFFFNKRKYSHFQLTSYLPWAIGLMLIKSRTHLEQHRR